MNLIQAAENHFKAQMDRYALQLNMCINAQGNFEHDILDTFLATVQNYEQALAQFNVVQNLKAQLLKTEQSETEAGNEG
tara:strand:- start:125 stop:361 length:237 start_codon:yes stop_codon:yes gene_type:complete